MKNLVLVSAVALGFTGLSSMAVAAPTAMSDLQLNGVAAGLTWNISQSNIAFNDLVDANHTSSSNVLCLSGNRNHVDQSGTSGIMQTNSSGISQVNAIRF